MDYRPPDNEIKTNPPTSAVQPVTSAAMSAPLRDPRLEVFGRLVGTWALMHRDLQTGEEWAGQDAFSWIDGGRFLAFNHEEHGRVKGLMVIGRETRWGEDSPSEEILGHWFDSTTGEHFIYIWELLGNTLTFWLEQRGGEFVFTGTISPDNNSISGQWTWPGGGYTLTMTRS